MVANLKYIALLLGAFSSMASFAQTPSTIYSYVVPSGGYVANGNLQTYTDSVTGTWNLSYDGLNRLTNGTVTPPGNQSQYLCWSYDSFGNRTTQLSSDQAFSGVSNPSSTPNPIPNTCSPSGTASNIITTPNNQNQISATNARGVAWTPQYDAAGDLTSDGVNSMVYDAEGRLCAVSSSIGGTTQYLYNAEGQRVAKGYPTVAGPLACPTNMSNFAATATYVLGQSGEQVTEMAVSGGTSSWKHTNVYAAGTLLATYDQEGLHYNLSDALGTKRVQVLVGTNATVALDESCSSLPFGDGLSCNGSGDDATEHHFTGKERDTESGNDYFGARYYASLMGRFMSPDPTGLTYANAFNPQSLNLYSYVLNNPLKFIDPTGQDCVYLSDDAKSLEEIDADSDTSEKDCKLTGGTHVEGHLTGYGSTDSDGTLNQFYSDSPLQAINNAATSQYYIQMQQLNGSIPTAQQYLAAIAQTSGKIPNVCSFGASALVGSNRLGGGFSADTASGVHLASSVNLGHPNGYGPSLTLTGGANGNVSYVVPVPYTPFVASVGTHNGNLDQIQSVGVGTRGSLVNVSLYANIGTFSQCK